MSDFYVGQKFRGTYPPEASMWCNSHEGTLIKELEKDGDTRVFCIANVEYTDEELAEQIRTKRNFLLNEIEWRASRYRNQKDQGIETTDTAEQYQAVLVYMQALRDVTNQEGFPRNVVFPSVPSVLQ